MTMQLYAFTRSSFKRVKRCAGVSGLMDGPKISGQLYCGQIWQRGSYGGDNKLPMNPTNLTHLTPMVVQTGYAAHGWRRVRRVRRVDCWFIG